MEEMINFFKKKANPSINSGQVPSVDSGQVEKIRAHIFVSGEVQGVFFRENTRKKAEKLGVFGWVKNLKDGRVEAVLEGNRERIEEIVQWARKGPIWAKIDGLEAIWENYQGEFKGFEIRYDL